jgi:hypothetical protein
MKFEKTIPVADRLPADTEMIGEAMPLDTKENNDHIRDFLNKNGEHLKKELLDKVLCGH